MSEARGWYPRRSMARKNSPKSHAGDVSGKGPLKDPWGAFGYLVSGVAVYGLIGWGLDQWLDTSFLVAIGIVAGAGLGIYMTLKALQVPTNSDEHKN
jgi:ATP synthase protein I